MLTLIGCIFLICHLQSVLHHKTLKESKAESGMDCQIREHLDFKMSKIKTRFCLALATSCLATFWQLLLFGEFFWQLLPFGTNSYF